jgi:CDP-diacylglycerol--glycerol-3-phosphate 3-phosphatidyltransferase
LPSWFRATESGILPTGIAVEGNGLPSVYDLKPKFQNLLRPLCAAMARGGITANQVTASAAVLSIMLGGAIAATHGAAWTLFLLPPVLFARMALNAIDGMLAREFNQKSRLGAVLNELGDVVSDTALYLPFALIAGVSPILVSLVVVIGVMTEMAGVVAVQIGAPRRYDGPFGKSDRAVFLGALGFALALGLAPGLWTEIVLGLAALAGTITVVNRARAALKEQAT